MTSIRRKVLVVVTAENMLVTTPRASVSANPITMLVPKVDPNQNRIPQVIRVEMLESRMDD